MTVKDCRQREKEQKRSNQYRKLCPISNNKNLCNADKKRDNEKMEKKRQKDKKKKNTADVDKEINWEENSAKNFKRRIKALVKKITYIWLRRVHVRRNLQSLQSSIKI